MSLTIQWLNKIDGLDLGDPQKNVNASDMNEIKTVTNTNAGTLDIVAGDLSTHTANTSNPHNVTKAQVGLGSVDNTPDASKPVSTAQQTALDLKANINNPTFTGIPAAPTAAAATDTTQVATTAFVHDAIGNDTVWGEVPSGAINDVNDTYTIATTAQKLAVYKNGLRQNPSSYTFTPGTNTFVMAIAPETGDTLLTDYQK